MDKPEHDKNNTSEYDLPPGIELPGASDIPDYPNWKAGWICGIILMIIALVISGFIPLLPPEYMQRWQVMLFTAIAAFIIGFAIAAFRPSNRS